jgi:cytoskeleton protein RodZ
MSDQQHIPGTPSSNDEPHPQSEAMQPRHPLPGAVLAGERQARGWSVEYVASHLKLAIRQIHALEEDRYEALPSPVVIRGFIRIYAKMLGIDSTALVAGLPATPAPVDAQIRPSRTLSTPFSESSLPLRGQHEAPLGRIVWIVLGVLVIVAVLAALKYGNWGEIKNSSLLQRLHIGSTTSDSTAPKPEAAAPDADSADPATRPAVVADNESTVPSEVVAEPSEPAVSAAAPAPVAAAVVPVTPTAPVASAPAPAAAAAPANAVVTPAPATPLIAANLANPLQLTINQDSWIEIRRADKSIVVSRIMKAGTTEAFDVNEPMSLIVGNAAGVDATLRGKALALASTTSNNVARLDLK